MRKKDWRKLAVTGRHALTALGIGRKRSALPMIAGVGAATVFASGLVVGLVPRFRMAARRLATRMLPAKLTLGRRIERQPEANDIQRAEDDGMSSVMHS